MSDSREVMSNLVGSYHQLSYSSRAVQSPSQHQNAEKKRVAGILGASSSGGSTQNDGAVEVGDDDFDDASPAMIDINSGDGARDMMSTEGEAWIGALVTKEFSGVRYIGKVTSYAVETGMFKIEYENNTSGEVVKEEMIQLLATPDLVRSYCNRASARNAPPRKAARRGRKPGQGRKAPTAPRQKKGEPSTYVPLAIRERKRDAYYWYY